MGEKMNDNEIIKEATEAVTKGYPCAFYVPLLLEVIKSKDAENERLQNESIGNCEMAIAMRSDHNLDVDCNYCIDKAKSEAYREFAEKIKEGEVYMRVDFPNTECGTETYIVLSDDIDTTLKELTENNDLEESET